MLRKPAFVMIIIISAFYTLVMPTQAAEWTKSSPYYEEDAWYDISEWLDGNDYNPTDESLGTWDDESYDSNVASTDYDDDYGDGDYGYDDSYADDDWFYDYYDYDYSYYDDFNDGNYGYSYRYYDYDNDGFSDAYSNYTDSDGDGIFEDYEYFAFNQPTRTTNATGSDSENSSVADNNAGNNASSVSQRSADSAQQSQADQNTSSKRLEVRGKVERTKRVNVPIGPQRLIAEVKSDDNQMFLVDLGAASHIGFESNENKQAGDQQPSDQKTSNPQGAKLIKQGESITARGPAIKVGDKQLILAQTAEIGDREERQINRLGRTVSGEITKMKSAQVRGREHQLVMVELESGKQAMVDLGRQDDLPNDLAEGDRIEVTGIPTKVNDRLVFIANSVSKDGENTKIHRITAMATEKS